MNSKHIVLSAIIGAVVVAVAGFGFYAIDMALSQKGATPALGAPQAYQALNNQNLLSELTLVNAPLANIPNGVTSAIDFTNLTDASGTTTQATTTVVTGLAASLGDAVIVEPNTPTAGATFIGQVTTASTTSATVTITEVASQAVDATSTTFTVIVLPASTFKSSGA